MILDRVGPGERLPDEINVIIEIPMRGEPVKYEVDKATGAMFVDRFLDVSMVYPCNYGYVPHTLGEDGDPMDVLVPTPVPLISGAVIVCRPIGMLAMTDESGGDTKILALPVDKVYRANSHVRTPADLSEALLRRIQHFFEHYKDLEAGKWVKVEGWRGPEEAREALVESVQRHSSATPQPRF